MSRSFKHTPTSVHCRAWCKSQKKEKRIGNRIMRRSARILTRVGDPDVALYQTYDQAMNVYCMPQDGTRHYVSRRRLLRMYYSTQGLSEARYQEILANARRK